MQRCTLLALSAMVFAATAARAIAQSVTGIPTDELGDAYRVLGRTGTPLGTMVTLHGVVRRGGRDIDDFREPVLQVQKINGRASQECIEVPIRPQGTGFGEPHYVLNLDAPQPPKPDLERSLPRLEFGRTYEFRGYETGGFVGAPDEAAYDGGVCRQSRGFYFASEFVVAKGKRIPPIAFSPADFLGRKALVHGTARNRDGRAWLAGPGWEIEVVRGDVWSGSILGARVAVTGAIYKESSGPALQIREYRVRRDGLREQIGRHVELRGEVKDSNSFWFLFYGSRDVLVENMDRLVAAHSLDYGSAVEVRGILRKERLPNQISSGPPKEQFIVREASCAPVNDLLPIERLEEPCPWSIGAGQWRTCRSSLPALR
jgi:hypothetical protein